MPFSWGTVRGRLGIALVAAAALGAGLMEAVHVARPGARNLLWEMPARMEERLRPVRPFLPPRGRIGYIGDATPQFASLRFCLAQYALIPLILENRPDRAYVVGDFEENPSLEAVCRRHDLTLIRDLGGGVVLFRGRGSP